MGVGSIALYIQPGGINMENMVIVIILLVIVGAAILYIRKEKKKGTRCIGCPSGGCCSCKECGKIKES